jgi:hypothetical protein
MSDVTGYMLMNSNKLKIMVFLVAIAVVGISVISYEYLSILGNKGDVASPINNSTSTGQNTRSTSASTFINCPGQNTYASIENYTGFVDVTTKYKDQQGSLGLYEFLLRPNSTGHITIVYDFGAGNSHPDFMVFNYINNTIWKLNGTNPLIEMKPDEMNKGIC